MLLRFTFVRIVWRIVHILLLGGGIIFYVGLTLWALSFETSFDIKGTVVDADTGRPVSRAKVIVAAWHSPSLFTAGPHKFGTVTDEKGNFLIAVWPGFVVAWRDVMALSPDNQYAELLELKADVAPLAVRPLTYWERDLDSYHYQTFEGRWTGTTKWLNTK